MKNKAFVAFKRAVLIFFILLIWKYASTKVNPLFIPDPKTVFDDFVQMIFSGQLFIAAIYSFRRISIATVIAAFVSVPMGLLVYNFTIARDIIKPISDTMRYIPVTAFYPLLIMWFGIDDSMKIAFIFIAVFVYMLPSVILSLDEVNPSLIETGLTMGMSRLQIITMVQLPATLPSIVNSFIMMFGIGWTYISVAETVNAKYGLGWIIQQSSSRGRTDIVFVGIISIMIISVVFDSITKSITKRVFNWRYMD